MSAHTTSTLRAWRVPRTLRWATTSVLMSASVILGVAGQAVLTGLPALALLMLSALCLGGLSAFLLWAYRGDVVIGEDRLCLPGGSGVPRRRVVGCHVEEEPQGGVLVLDLELPREQWRVPTGQPVPQVQAFARGVQPPA